MKNLLLIFLVLLSTFLSAVEYGVLSSEGTNTLALSSGDVFEAIHWYGKGANSTLNLVDFTIDESSPSNTLTVYPTSDQNPIVVGPSSIFLTETSNYYHTPWVMFKITRASELEYKNVNIISLPSSSVGQGTHNIVVEASDDLQSWTPVHSSSIGGDKAFFRTRVVEAE